jgi:uncharacterized membrane protein
MALVIDVGFLAVVRNKMQAAADFGALAGVQNLNLEALQEGSIVLDSYAAKKDAKRWTEENVFRNLHPFIDAKDLEVSIKVHNSYPDKISYDCYNGRMISVPTVCVMIESDHQFYFIHGVFGKQKIVVHADASVLTKD